MLAFIEQHLPDQLELTVARAAAAAQNQRVLALDDLWVNNDDARRVTCQVTPAQSQPRGESVFDLRVPRPAVRGEVAGVRTAADERVLAQLGLVRDVEKAARPVKD